MNVALHEIEGSEAIDDHDDPSLAILSLSSSATQPGTLRYNSEKELQAK